MAEWFELPPADHDECPDPFAEVDQGAGWRPPLRSLGVSAWDTVQAHPCFARLAFSRPSLGPRALDMYEAALAEPRGVRALR